MKERIVLWDNIKFILITLVVIGHLADEFTINSNAYKSIFLFIYSFHMPAFIFISGLFHNEKNILKKCIFYSSIGFLYKIISLVIDRLSGNINVTFIRWWCILVYVCISNLYSYNIFDKK